MTSDSWCQYQRDQYHKTNMYNPGPGLDDDVIKEVKPIYGDLTKEEELSKCLHGQTQMKCNDLGTCPKSKLLWVEHSKTLCIRCSCIL